MFGHKAVLPIELDDNKKPIPDNFCIEENIEKLTSDRLTIFKEVKDNIKRAQLKQKEGYDRKHSIPMSFKVKHTC